MTVKCYLTLFKHTYTHIFTHTHTHTYSYPWYQNTEFGY